MKLGFTSPAGSRLSLPGLFKELFEIPAIFQGSKVLVCHFSTCRAQIFIGDVVFQEQIEGLDDLWKVHETAIDDPFRSIIGHWISRILCARSSARRSSGRVLARLT